MRIIGKALIHDALSRQKAPEYGNTAKALAVSFAYALENVPTRWLEESFRRAIQTKEDDFPITASSVNKAYNELLLELQAREQTQKAMREYKLKSGQGGPGLMSIDEFKARHNLPAAWKLGEPYPPESDLYGKPVPPSAYQKHLFRCLKCKDAGWTRIPYDALTNSAPVLMRCGCGQAGSPWTGTYESSDRSDY